ncbi:diguanylate cyclase domain-containing protein [Ilumatobacter sp.]|uniref:GGDEF domain-containing protein n=1 Tax=Ilumatobacter sp. TaxID=1967498 RepID=UPI003AF99855
MVMVLDEVGTILQVAGSSLATLGYDPDALVGDNALNYVSPRHVETITFVFNGPGDHVVRNVQEPFPLELIGSDGEPTLVDCAAERVHRDGEVLWVVTMMPHSLQSAAFHALTAFGRGASAHEVGTTIAERLSWSWEARSEIRTFLLADTLSGVFTTATEPGATHQSGSLLRELAGHVADPDAPWNRDLTAPHVTIPAETLPAAIASAASAAGFVVACIAVGRLDGEPQLGIVSFGVHEHAFQGNFEMIMTESVATLEMTLQREGADDKLRRAREEDPLTGLANRITFSKALIDCGDATSAVLYIDVDHFKEINDSFGHAAGDAILIEIGRRLRLMCRPDDLIARIGSDEFAVLLTGVDPTRAERMAHRILARICEPLPEGLGPECIEASGGLAIAACDDDAVQRAGLAMLASKRAGRAQLIIA